MSLSDQLQTTRTGDVFNDIGCDGVSDAGGDGLIATEAADEDVFFDVEDGGGEELSDGPEIVFGIEQASTDPGASKVVGGKHMSFHGKHVDPNYVDDMPVDGPDRTPSRGADAPTLPPNRSGATDMKRTHRNRTRGTPEPERGRP